MITNKYFLGVALRPKPGNVIKRVFVVSYKILYSGGGLKKVNMLYSLFGLVAKISLKYERKRLYS